MIKLINVLALLAFLSNTASFAGDFKPSPALQPISEEERKESHKLAHKFWFHSVGLLAEESLVSEGSFKLGRNIEGFAKRGTMIWQVRVKHLDGGTNGLIWINSKTKEIRSLGANLHSKKKVEQDDEGNVANTNIDSAKPLVI